jgi:hypothetical protein
MTLVFSNEAPAAAPVAPRAGRFCRRRKLVYKVGARFAFFGSCFAVRFAVAIVAVILLALAGLFVFGLSLKPDTRTIEQDAVGLPDA